MSRYSTFLNLEVTENNSLAVSNAAADSFIAGGLSSNIAQTAFTNVAVSGTKLVAHDEDSSGARIVQVVELIPGATGQTNTSLDFDLADADQFIQQTASGIDFNGTATLHNTGTGLTPATFDPGDIGYAVTLSDNNTHFYCYAVGGNDYPNGFGSPAFQNAPTRAGGGKWYYELSYTSAAPVCRIVPYATYHVSFDFTNSPSIWVAGARMGVAINLDANEVTIYKNGVFQTTVNIASITDTWVGFATIGSNGGPIDIDIYTDPAEQLYSPPNGFYAGLGTVDNQYSISTENLASPTLLLSMEGDDSPNQIELTHAGTVIYDVIPPIGRGAILLKSNTDYLLTGNMFDVGTGAFTVEYWIKPHVSDADDYAFAMHTAPYLQVYHGATGQIWLWSQTDGSKSIGTPYMNLDQWNHVAIVRISTSDLRVFVNGHQTLSTTWNANYSSAGPIYLGRNPGHGVGRPRG